MNSWGYSRIAFLRDRQGLIKTMTRFIVVFALLLFSSEAFCVIFIDVSGFDYEGEKGIRVCIFSTDLSTKLRKKLPPSYILINYYPNSLSEADDHVPSGSLNQYHDLVITYGGNITIPDGFNPGANGYIVRTRVVGGVIMCGAKKIAGQNFDSRVTKSGVKTEDIVNELNNCHITGFGADFPVNSYKKDGAYKWQKHFGCYGMYNDGIWIFQASVPK